MATVEITLHDYPKVQVVTWLWVEGHLRQDWFQDAREGFVVHESGFVLTPEELHMRMIRFEARAGG